MSSSNTVAWDRLIRYIPKGGDQVHIGDPILEGAEINVLIEANQLKARVLKGAHFVEAKPTGQVEEVGTLLGPVAANDVPIIRCIVLETGRPLPTCPTIFTKPGPAIADYGEDVPIPKLAQQQCDYEGELVVVLGKDAKNVSEENALEYVAGYTVGNDVSARDWQRDASKAGPVPQWGFSKSFDKYAPLGPCLVSAHILGDAAGLGLRTIVNGETRQDSHTSDLVFGVKSLVAYCSQGQTLQKGSMIMTGTPGGVGLFMKPPAFLKDGDRVEVEIEKIGRLTNVMRFEN